MGHPNLTPGRLSCGHVRHVQSCPIASAHDRYPAPVILGTLKTRLQRLTDVLNEPDAEHLVLFEATFMELGSRRVVAESAYPRSSWPTCSSSTRPDRPYRDRRRGRPSRRSGPPSWPRPSPSRARSICPTKSELQPGPRCLRRPIRARHRRSLLGLQRRRIAERRRPARAQPRSGPRRGSGQRRVAQRGSSRR